jgi:hypothetical protein
MTRGRICIVFALLFVSCNLFDTDETTGLSANLKALTIYGGTLSPPFDSNITQYTLTFPSYPRSFELIAEAEDSAATILVNGVSVPSGQRYQVHTSPPNFVANITVTSANQKNSKTYVLQLSDT